MPLEAASVVLDIENSVVVPEDSVTFNEVSVTSVKGTVLSSVYVTVEISVVGIFDVSDEVLAVAVVSNVVVSIVTKV